MASFGESSVLKPGALAPAFKLPLLSGGESSLQNLLAGGPVVLAFFKVSCPVCQMAFPYLERLHRGGLRVVGVSQDKVGLAAGFVKEFGVSFPVLLDDTAGYPVSNAFGISVVPTLFTVEPDGRIASVSEGFVKRDIETLGARVGAVAFTPADRVPEFRPG